MKKTLFIFILCGWAFISNAQTTKQEIPASSSAVSVEKSIFGIQTGFLGIWINNEVRLSKSIVLRSELGFATKIWKRLNQKTGFLMTPVVRLEPRWYYNLKKRASKGKRIDGNSGNFLALQMSYYPGGTAISNYDNVNINPTVSVSSLWGIKRNIGDHFNYEVALGLGYAHYFPDKEGYGEGSGAIFGLLLRIGYRF